MYIYNVTINIEESVHDKWLEWMKTEHIPDMLKTGKFTKALMTRVMVEEAMGGITYSVQYTAPNKKSLQNYYEENAQDLRARGKAYAGKMVVFRTELEVITEQEFK